MVEVGLKRVVRAHTSGNPRGCGSHIGIRQWSTGRVIPGARRVRRRARRCWADCWRRQVPVFRKNLVISMGTGVPEGNGRAGRELLLDLQSPRAYSRRRDIWLYPAGWNFGARRKWGSRNDGMGAGNARNRNVLDDQSGVIGSQIVEPIAQVV